MQETPDQESAPSGRGEFKKWGVRAIVAVCAISALAYATPKILYSFSHEGTDDAYIDGNVVPISPEVKGMVKKVFVSDNQPVKAGDVLVEISPDDYLDQVQARRDALSRMTAEQQEIQAAIKVKSTGLVRVRADLSAAETNAALAGRELKRSEALIRQGIISQSKYDIVQSRWKAATAQRDAASAAVAEAQASIEGLTAQLAAQKFKMMEAGSTLDLARRELGRTEIIAPVGGRIAKKNVDEGKYVQPGQPLLSIVDDTDLWVVANFKETQLNRMRPGQPVDIAVDAYPGITLAGHVDSFQSGTGAVFSLLPPQNATGNFVKVVQRVPVKIIIDSKPDPAHPLRPGLSVYPSVATKEPARP